MAQQSAPTIDWLVTEHEIDLTVKQSWRGLGHRHPRLHAPANRSGETLLAMLLDACEKIDAPVVTAARVHTVYSDEKL